MALEKELQTYHRELSTLLQHEGKYVLIKVENVIDCFDSYEDAIKAGYARFGLDPFLVKKIQAVEQVQYFSRSLAPCRT